jgi:hypothetical protein
LRQRAAVRSLSKPGGPTSTTTVRLLGPHLTVDNHAQVLESARGKRKAEVEEIVAALAPRPDVPASIRKLPARTVVGTTPAVSCSSVAEPGGSPIACLSSALGTGSSFSAPASAAWLPAPPPDSPLSAPAPAPAHEAAPVLADGSPIDPGACLPADPLAAPGVLNTQGLLELSADRHEHPAEVTPLSPDRYRYQLTIGRPTLEKLRLAKDLIRHALPSGDDETILDRALGLLLDDLAKRKLGSEESTRPPRKRRRTRAPCRSR